MKTSILLILLFIFSFTLKAENRQTDDKDDATKCDTLILDGKNGEQFFLMIGDTCVSTQLNDSLPLHSKKRKKIIAAVLAFPLPFGILGLHRIFLGTKPYIPFAYIGTIGGCLGILPLVDFITIITSKKELPEHFENNSRVFMWSH